MAGREKMSTQKTLKITTRVFGTLILLIIISNGLLHLINIDNIYTSIALFISGFFLFLFIPGFLIIRVLKINIDNYALDLIFSIGISLSIIMIEGALCNILISDYFSKKIIIFVINYFTILGLLSYYIYKIHNIVIKTIIIDKVVLLTICISMLLPLISYIGILNSESYGTNLILLIEIVILSSIIILYNFISSTYYRLYPLLLFSISLSLLIPKSLISPFIWMGDSSYEYVFAYRTIVSGNWELSLFDNMNSIPLITILYPLITILLNLDLVYVFKIVYPIIFSLVPVAIFEINNKIIKNDKFAYYGSVLFISFYTNYGEMLSVTRQGISELFLVIFVIVVLWKIDNSIQGTLLKIIVIISIIWSHYGLFWLFFISISVFTLFYSILIRNDKKYNNLKNTSIVLIFVMGVSWYFYISGSSVIESLIGIGGYVGSSIFDIFNSIDHTGLSQGLNVGYGSSILWKISYLIQIGLNVLLTIGIIKILSDKQFSKRIKILYSFLFIVLIIIIIVPYLAPSMNVTRMYHIMFIFLSLVVIIGLMSIIRKFSNTSLNNIHINKLIPSIIPIVLVIFLLFQSGFIFEIASDYPSSYSLSRDRINSMPDSNISLNFAYFQYETDHTAGTWLIDNCENNPILTDYRMRSLFIELSYDEFKILDYTHIIDKISNYDGAYLFLSERNVIRGYACTIQDGEYSYLEIKNTDMPSIVNDNYIIYSSLNNKIVGVDS